MASFTYKPKATQEDLKELENQISSLNDSLANKANIAYQICSPDNSVSRTVPAGSLIMAHLTSNTYWLGMKTSVATIRTFISVGSYISVEAANNVVTITNSHTTASLAITWIYPS